MLLPYVLFVFLYVGSYLLIVYLIVICGVVGPYCVVAVEISDYNLWYVSVSQWREYKLLAGWRIDKMYDYIG